MIDDLWLSTLLYLLGSLFMAIQFEPSEDGPRYAFFLLVFAWPLMTVWFLILDLLTDGEEE